MHDRHRDAPRTNHRRRRSPRLAEYDYRAPGWYFVTVCTHRRARLLATRASRDVVLTEAGRIVRASWRGLPSLYADVRLDAFVVMPDHVHGVIGLLSTDVDDAVSLSRVVRAFKSISGRRVNQSLNRRGVPLWQRGFHEHVVRNPSDLERIRRYVAENPYRSSGARRVGEGGVTDESGTRT